MKNKIRSICAATVLALLVTVISLDTLFPLKYYGFVKKYCNEYSVEPSVALAVIWTESKFQADAVSVAGACGLMQLMPSTAAWLCDLLGEQYTDDRLFEPEFNIRLGVYYLSYLQKSFDGDMVLAAYNAGEGNVKKWLLSGGEIRFAETRQYVKKVNAIKRLYSLRVGKHR